MASGDVVGMILQSLPTGSTRADPGIRVSATTTGGAENFPVVRFDDTTTEYWDFLCALEGYNNSSGLTIELPWCAVSSANQSEVCRWVASIRRLQDDTVDLDTAFDYTTNAKAVSDTPANVIGELSYPVITFANGTEMNGLVNKERFMLRVWRDASVGSDLTGDASLLWPAIVIRET